MTESIQCINKEILIYTEVVFSSIGALISLFYIYLFMRLPKSHKSPGDIYFGMSIAELIYALHFLTYSVYFITYNKSLDGFPTALCIINELAFSFAVILIYAYTIQLYMHMVVRLIFTLKAKKIQKWQGHLYSWIIAFIYSLITYFFETGVCGLGLSKYAPFTYIILLLSVYMVAISAKIYIEQEIGDKENLMKQGRKFIRFLKILFTTQAIIATTILFASLFAYIINVINIEWSCMESILLFIASIFSAFVPVILPLVRYLDPFLQKRVSELLNANQQQKEKSKSIQLQYQSQYQEIQEVSSPIQIRGSLEEVNNDQFSLTQRKKQFSVDDTCNKSRGNTLKFKNTKTSRTLEKESDEDDRPFIHQLTNQLRTEILKRILAFILIQEQDKIQACEKYKKFIREGKNGHFDDLYVFQADQQQLWTMFPDHFPCQGNTPDTTFKMTSHALDVYNILIQQDQEKIDIKNCLDLELNKFCIEKCAQTTGGKSGEFFFFNHNNRLLLKTISEPELKVLKNIQENYFWHINNYPNTTLAKILGIFTFEGFEVGRISLILMKNISKISSEAFISIYDMKGSSHDREVLKKTKSPKKKSSSLLFLKDGLDFEPRMKYSQVLKDMDFLKIERQLHIAPNQAEILYKQLEADTLFLKTEGLMDYSLCVIKIDWLDYFNQKTLEESSDQTVDQDLIIHIVESRVSKLQHCYPSLIDKGIYYHIGIIDYLQTYNVNKKAEKYTKILLKMNTNLDTSSQDPQKYRQRFLSFVNDIL